MRKLVMLACVGLLGAAAGLAPSLGSAQATTASFVAVDGRGPLLDAHYWYASGTTNTAVTILPGGTVSFAYPPAGVSVHGVVFTGGQPSACTQATAPPGYKVAAAPPLPQMAEPGGWSGSCRFDTAGIYAFQCLFHGPAMSGTVVVARADTTTTTQPPTTQPTTAPAPTTTTYGVVPIPPASSGLRAPPLQRGGTVSGQIHVTAPGSRLVADLLLDRSTVRVGRTTLHGVADGTQRFTVHLSATGRKALRRRHRLALTLRVQVLLVGGLGPTTLIRHVTLIG